MLKIGSHLLILDRYYKAAFNALDIGERLKKEIEVLRRNYK